MSARSARAFLVDVLPGLALCALFGVLGLAAAVLQVRVLGRAIVDALVAAIVLAMVARVAWTPARLFEPGIRFAGRGVLETAVCLLGATVNFSLLVDAGPRLAAGIVALVVMAIAIGSAIGRAAGLAEEGTLVACGNAICGNSAIASVAPVIRARADQVATATAFTALVGVVIVFALPLVAAPRLSPTRYGVLAGLTVYAVPQVIAAAAPAGAVASQVAMLVKLTRVLLLGPVVVFFGIREGTARSAHLGRRARDFFPWFLVGFILLAAMRSTHLLPAVIVEPARQASHWLTIGAMAAMGLSVSPTDVARAGPRLAVVVAASLAVMIALSLALIRSLHLA